MSGGNFVLLCRELQIIELMGFLKYFVSLVLSCTALAVMGHNDTVRVSMITCHAGSDIYELCGHSALRIQAGGDDIAVNYGMFDFDAPNFVYRFVKGETDYMVGAYPFERFLRSYLRDGRRVVEQELNLTQQQSRRMLRLVEENLLPENRVYRYNYVKDNCATRPVAIIERAIGDTITFPVSETGGVGLSSFRDEMRRFHKNYPWYQFGIDLCLGNGIDYVITAREKGFAPETLEQLLCCATIPDSAGVAVPLVKRTSIINEGKPGGVVDGPTPWYITPMAVAWLLLAVIVAVSVYDIRRRGIFRVADTLLFGIEGLAGCLLTFLIFVSVHEATSPNWLYLWLNPLCFIPAVVVWTKKHVRLLMSCHFANFVALFLLLILLGCGVQSGNPAFIPLILASAIRSITCLYNIRCSVKTKA